MAVFRRAHTTQLKRRCLRGLALAGVVALPLLAAACGGGSPSSKVAQIGTTASKSGPTRSTANEMAYSACMRSHGVPNFPDPDANGRILITSGVDSSGHKTGVDMNTPQAKKAGRACQKLQPNGGRPTATQQAEMQQEMLKYAQCMRAHGVPKFPDPKAGGALSIGAKAGVDPNTPQFRAAAETCHKILPGSPMIAPPPAPPSGGSGSGSGSGQSINP